MKKIFYICTFIWITVCSACSTLSLPLPTHTPQPTKVSEPILITTKMPIVTPNPILLSDLTGYIGFYSNFAQGFCLMEAASMTMDSTVKCNRIVDKIHGEMDISPDRKKAAFVMGDRTNGWNIYAVIIGGNEVQQLTKGLNVNEQPDWSPDGKRIVFTTGGLIGGGGISIISADGSNEKDLIPSSVASYLDFFGSPTWSPDGKRIAFSAKLNDRNEIFTIESDGNGLARVTNGMTLIDNFAPAWSHDGNYISYITKKEDGTSDIQIVSLKNGDVTPLSVGIKGINHSSWSPDSKYIIFSTRSDMLFLVSVNDYNNIYLIGRGQYPCWVK